MTTTVLDTGLVGMHGDVVPAYSAWEWLSRLFVRFLGPQNDGEPSLSTQELMEEFRDWTVERTTPPAPSDPDVTPVEAPSFPISQALYDNAFRTDLKSVLGLDREVVLAYDVSVHQGAVDHRAFREAGYTMGICKATEGGSASSGKGFLDKRFKENWAEMEVATCGSCHIDPEKAETPKCSNKKKKDNPYHINCIGCHKAAKAEDAEIKAPTKCTACHPKVAK